MPDLPEGRSKRVCVIGGGIAGLVAAYELKKLGHDVTLLEASSRCGGRIYTYRFDADNYGDLGAMRFPMDHRCSWKYVDEFRLKTDTFVQRNQNALYYLRGQPIKQGPWAPLDRAYPDLYPKVSEPVGRHSPADELDRWIEKLTVKLTPAEQWEAFSPGPLRGRRLRNFDRFSVWQHVQGILPPVRATFPWTLSASARPFLNDEEWEYIGRSMSTLWDEKTSYLEALVDTVPHQFSLMYRIVGGTEKLIDALKASLATEIHTESPVTNITNTSNDVRVRWGSGDLSREAAFEYVICAVPAGPTARIQFEPALDAAKHEALTNITYQPAAKSLVFCKTRRWETSHHIFGGGSRTDMQTQECWYPSDNASPDPNPQGPPDMERISYPDGSTEYVRVVSEWVAKDPEVSKGPGVLIAGYMWGLNAHRFASLTNDERDTLVMKCMEKLHPGIKDDILACKHWSWDNQPNTGGGGWAAFMPGDRGRYQEALVAPYRSGHAADPRVFFAGEHLGISHAWMQGAIQTAQGAVYHVHNA